MNTEERLQLVLQQPAINELNANVVSDKMVDIISQCAMLMGFKVPEPRELTLMAGKVTADLYESYPKLVSVSSSARKGSSANTSD